eukprot:gene20051-22788_t
MSIIATKRDGQLHLCNVLTSPTLQHRRRKVRTAEQPFPTTVRAWMAIFHFTASMAMNVTIQSKKRQKCFMIDPKDGVVQAVQSFSAEDEQSFAISKLELWQRAGLSEGSDVMDVSHKKLLQFNDVPLNGLDKKNKDDKVDVGERMKNAVESAQKAAAELSMLVQLSSLLKANNILSLQHKYTDSIPTEDLHTSGKPTKDAPQEVPVAQRISIQRTSFRNAKTSILSSLEHVKSLMKQRQQFTNTLQLCQQDKDFNLCYVDRKTQKRVTHRKYEPRKDFIASDCSIHVPAGTTAANNDSTKAAKWTQRPADTTTTSATATAFVPILMGKEGMELSTAEIEAPVYTLQISLLTKNENSTAQNNPIMNMLGCISAWSLLQAKDDNCDASMEVESTDTVKVDTVQALAAHCARRKHETLCRTAFTRLQEECIREATQWDVLSGFSVPDVVDPFETQNAENRETIVSALHAVISGKDSILKRVVVVDLQEKRVVLRVSEKLILTAALVPIVDNDHSSVSSGAVHSGTGGIEWIDSALSAMALQSLLCVLRPNSTTTSSQTKNNDHTTTTVTAVGLQRQPLFGKRTGLTNFASKSTEVNVSMTTTLLQMLAQRVNHKRNK